jgi:hypothetical protein
LKNQRLSLSVHFYIILPATLIIISLTTLIAYLWALYYEVGFFEYFSLPYYLISLNPSIVLATNAVLVIVFGGVFAVVYIVINRLPEIWYRIVIGVLFIAALFFCRVCRIEGRNEAKRQEKFLIVKQNLGVPGVDTEVAVLRVYGEYLFAVPINRADKKFEKKLVILKMSDMPKTPLNLEKIGPLEEKP